MVTRLIVLLWLAILTTSTWAQPHFGVTADKHDIVLGEAITVTIRAQDINTPLNTLNLDVLKTHFDTYTRSSNKQTELIKGIAATTETTTLILYPLQSGQLQLPSFKFAGNTSQPVAITVHESGPDIPRVIFKLTLEPTHLLSHQVATLNLDIYDDGSLQWSPPKLPASAGIYIRELAESQLETTLNGTVFTVHRLSWAIMPLNTGNMTLHFPIINALKFGNRLRYAVPSLQFDTRPTPRYLPAYVPVGKLTVTSHPPSGRLILDRPVNWDLVVRGAGISVEGLAKLLPSMMDTESLHFYPPHIRWADENSKSLEQTLLVTVPFQPLRAGTIQLPEIELPYYNPVTERIESTELKSPLITVVNPFWHTASQFITIVAILGLLIGLARLSLRIYQRKHIRNTSLRRIAAATNSLQLNQALLAFDWGVGAIPANTLRLWLAKIEHNHDNAQLAQLVQQLETRCYNTTDTKPDWSTLQQTALLIMSQIKTVKIAPDKV